MATGDHDWTAGEQVTAANMDDYLQLQVTGQYASNATRDTALSARKRENMVTAQADTNCLTVYSGAAWSTIGPVHGALTTYVPTLTQSGAVTKTVTYASYTRFGRWVMGSVRLDVTGAGSASNAITVSTPVTALSGTVVVGSGYWNDASAAPLVGLCALLTTTTFGIYTASASILTPLGSTSSASTAALASGDIINLSFMYEAAADA